MGLGRQARHPTPECICAAPLPHGQGMRLQEALHGSRGSQKEHCCLDAGECLSAQDERPNDSAAKPSGAAGGASPWLSLRIWHLPSPVWTRSNFGRWTWSS